MKTFFFYMIALSVFLGCENTLPENHSVSVIIDRTEDNFFKVEPEYVLKHISNINTFDGIELSIIDITDTAFSSRQSFIIEKGKSGLLSNEDSHRRRLKLLKRRFTDSLIASNEMVYDYQRSDIFRVVAKELNRLAEREGNRTILLVSDLKEHSFFSVYDSQSLMALFQNQQSVIEQFENVFPIKNDLSDITLHILYKPSLEDAELFSNMISLYKSVLEPRGLQIVVGHQETITI